MPLAPRQSTIVRAVRRVFPAVLRPAVVTCLAVLIGVAVGPLVTTARAGGGPENVLLVVNSSSWASLTVANEYVRLRQIPPNNLLYIDWDTGFEQIDVQHFRSDLLGRVLRTIDERLLSNQIDYVVYSSDFPFAINLEGDISGKAPPKQLAPLGSLNSLTYLWPLVMSKNQNVMSLRNNQYMRSTTDRAADPPVHGFHSWYGWGPDGQLLDAGGGRYLLSTVLAETSGRGNSVPETLEYLRRSVAADGTQPEGTIYFMQNDNERSKPRHGAFADAAAELQKLGVKAVVEQGTLPSARPDVQGAMIGASDFDWAASGSTILPGAICEHLTSLGGILHDTAGQTPLTEFLRFGAAGASGTVIEPFAIADKFPVAGVQVRYAEGCSLAEAFYQSVFGPYQLLIVGDALCRPWANIPQVEAGQIEADAKLSGVVEIVPHAEFSQQIRAGGDRVGRVDRFELMIDGRRTLRVRPPGHFRLDTTELADGYHTLHLVAVEAGPIETQGRTIVPVWVDNREHTIEFAATPADRVRWDQKLVLKANAPGMQAVAFFHNARLIGKLDQAEGQIEVDPRIFGSGPVTLRAVGLSRSGSSDFVHSRPIELRVEPARPLAALKKPEASKQQPGLLLKLANGRTVQVQDTSKTDWLGKAGVKPGETFEFQAYFTVPKEDVYQFQTFTAGEVRLTVDGTALVQAPAGKYRGRFAPVALAAGQHSVKVSGRAADPAVLRVLFGGRGTKSLDGARFSHVGG